MRQPHYKKLLLFILAGELFVMGTIGALILPDLIDEQHTQHMIGDSDYRRRRDELLALQEPA
jgi:hypothetical protein